MNIQKQLQAGKDIAAQNKITFSVFVRLASDCHTHPEVFDDDEWTELAQDYFIAIARSGIFISPENFCEFHFFGWNEGEHGTQLKKL